MDRKEVQKKFKELGFEWPSNEKELLEFDKKFADYPHKLDSKKVNPFKILADLGFDAQKEADFGLEYVERIKEKSTLMRFGRYLIMNGLVNWSDKYVENIIDPYIKEHSIVPKSKKTD